MRGPKPLACRTLALISDIPGCRASWLNKPKVFTVSETCSIFQTGQAQVLTLNATAQSKPSLQKRDCHLSASPTRYLPSSSSSLPSLPPPPLSSSRCEHPSSAHCVSGTTLNTLCASDHLQIFQRQNLQGKIEVNPRKQFSVAHAGGREKLSSSYSLDKWWYLCGKGRCQSTP